MNYDAIETAIDADELLEKIAEHEKTIAAAEAERNAFIERYQDKIDKAREICESKTAAERETIAFLTEQLRRFAETQISDKKRSVQLPSGTLSFRKQAPKFFFDDLSEASGKDERLIDFVRQHAHEFLKVTYVESCDWAEFKKRLAISDTGEVSYTDTGELVEGLHGAFLPDKFTVKTS